MYVCIPNLLFLPFSSYFKLKTNTNEIMFFFYECYKSIKMKWVYIPSRNKNKKKKIYGICSLHAVFYICNFIYLIFDFV